MLPRNQVDHVWITSTDPDVLLLPPAATHLEKAVFIVKVKYAVSNLGIIWKGIISGVCWSMYSIYEVSICYRSKVIAKV